MLVIRHDSIQIAFVTVMMIGQFFLHCMSPTASLLQPASDPTHHCHTANDSSYAASNLFSATYDGPCATASLSPAASEGPCLMRP